MLAVMGGHQGVVKAQPVAALLFFKESIEGLRLLSASSLHMNCSHKYDMKYQNLMNFHR